MKKNLLLIRNKITSCRLQSILILITVAGLLTPSAVHAQKTQEIPPDSIKYQGSTYQKVTVKAQYPKVVGYLSFILPLETFSSGNFTPNFSNHTSSIGFPVGVNVLYSDRFGFSYEFTPTIKASGGTSKMSNLLFDPGTMFRFDHGFTIISRLAFETSGRYGFTPVFNQVYARTKDVNYFVALSLPARFGNSEASSLGLNLQLGFTFN
ncbi:hypothetical protein [Mucilaginibacter sp.]|uniref:hypothetical protein n=1 Tax=Mucilaginibacter sp. TaxID=1882438 RepID=UPI0026047DAE|nr:hypothetical protein [Mucilaginibacter sp.]MDB5031744.1 hypothetical protein [Mucilaginibacter sp.]